MTGGFKGKNLTSTLIFHAQRLFGIFWVDTLMRNIYPVFPSLASSDLDTSEMVLGMDIFFNNIRLAWNLSNWQNKVLQSGTIRNELSIFLILFQNGIDFRPGFFILPILASRPSRFAETLSFCLSYWVFPLEFWENYWKL